MNQTKKGADEEAVPVAPVSLLSRYLGDRRFVLTLTRAVTLQVLHPDIAAAFVQHVPFRLWNHKRRSVSQTIYMFYNQRDPQPVIRFGHEHVKGISSTGHRYHALAPELFFFQHGTYVDSLVTAINTFIRPLSDAEHDHLYSECCAWFTTYGISTRAMPTTWAEFTDYFTDACATQLSVTPDAQELLSQALRPDSWIPARLPSFAARSLQHDRVKELLDIEQSGWEKAAFRAYTKSVRASYASRPHAARLIPQARMKDPR